MIGYTTVGANQFSSTAEFYDALFASMGISRLMEMETFILWGSSMQDAGFALAKPYDGNAASVGNGVMIALRAESQAQVDAIYAKAMALGASDEGEPGPRGDGFYAGYFRDPEGNKLNAFFVG